MQDFNLNWLTDNWNLKQRMFSLNTTIFVCMRSGEGLKNVDIAKYKKKNYIPAGWSTRQTRWHRRSFAKTNACFMHIWKYKIEKKRISTLQPRRKLNNTNLFFPLKLLLQHCLTIYIKQYQLQLTLNHAYRYMFGKKFVRLAFNK